MAVLWGGECYGLTRVPPGSWGPSLKTEYLGYFILESLADSNLHAQSPLHLAPE